MSIITSFGWSVRVCVVSPAWTLLERPNPNPTLTLTLILLN